MAEQNIFDRIKGKLNRPNNTPGRFINAVLIFLSEYFKGCHVLGIPEQITIEPTNICDLRCPLCPSGSGKMQRRRGFLSAGNFKKIIDEIGGRIYYLTLGNYGEPFLNKDTPGMISYAKQKRIVVSAVTNAQCIDRPTASRIVDSNLDRITISLDGVTQESYEKYRVGGKFYKAVEAIRSIVEEKSKKNTPFPFITVQFLVMRHNEDEMEEIKNLAAELRVDGLVFKKVCDMNEPLPDFGNIDKHMPRNAKYRAYKVENKSVRWNTGRKDIDFCGMAWNYPVITWDGELYPCCVAYDALSMGNVFEGGFKKAWNSERFVSFRKKLTEDKHSIYPCRDCGMNFYDDIIEKIAMTDKSYEP